MAEVQKGAQAVTADGADAETALLPIAGGTRAHCTLHTCTDHITHRVLFTCTHAEITLHTHRPHAQMHRSDNLQCTVHTLYSYAQLITHISHVQATVHIAHWSTLQILCTTSSVHI